MFLRSKGKAGTKKRTIEFANFAHPDPAFVQLRPLPATRGKEFVLMWVKDDRLFELFLMLQRDRNRELRETMQVIGCAVERIDDPAEFVAVLRSRLFRENGVVGIGGSEDRDNFRLSHAVDLGHEIRATLGLDGHPLKPIEMTHNDRSGTTRGADRRVEHGMHELTAEERSGEETARIVAVTFFA